MFRTGSFILRLLAALALLAIVLGGVAFAFQAGYSRGYMSGVAANGDGTQFAPGFPPAAHMMPYFGMHFFPPLGFFFCGSLLFVAFLGLFFRPWFWRCRPDWKEYPHGPWGLHHWAHEHYHDPEHASESKTEAKPPEAA